MSLIAEVKEKENIAEYILYMWQMEDLVRGNGLELDLVLQSVFLNRQPETEVLTKYRSWFADIIAEMKASGLEKSGHLEKVNRYMKVLDELHLALLITFQDKAYIELYNKACGGIRELRIKTGSNQATDICVCLTGLYGYLILKMKEAEISPDTVAAIQNIGKLTAFVSNAFKKMQSGKLKLPKQLNN